MNCKYLKQKLNRKLECKLTNKIITFKDCKECNIDKNERFTDTNKTVSNSHQTKKRTVSSNYCANSDIKTSKMSVKSKKLAKMERNRTSILTNDMEHCYICGSKKEHVHEVCFGKNRLNSIKYGLLIPVCFNCHMKIHNDINLQEEHHKIAQKKFNEVYPDLDFVEIFKRNYL